MQDPPPPGYQLYAGVEEPVSDSSLVKGPLQVPGKVFQLVCEHYRSVPVRTSASYVGFYDRLDRSSGFQSYPREWDSHEYEAVAGVVASVSFIGSDQIWGKEQRDAWLRDPSCHEWKWRPRSRTLRPSVLAANKSVYERTQSALDYLLTTVATRLSTRKTHMDFVTDVLEGHVYDLQLFAIMDFARTSFLQRTLHSARRRLLQYSRQRWKALIRYSVHGMFSPWRSTGVMS